MGVVSPTEGDLAFSHGQKAGVGNGDAVGIAGKIGEDLGGSGKRSLGIDDPVGLGGSAQESSKGGRRLEMSKLAGESELVFCKSSFEARQELPAEYPTEYFDRQKELCWAPNPSTMIWGESSSWNHAVHMGMKSVRASSSLARACSGDM